MHTKILRTGLFIYFIFLSFDGSTIERVTSIGAREASLSMAVISQSGAFSVFHNQAFLTVGDATIGGNLSGSAAVSFRQPFLISGYSESALSVVIPSRDIVFAVGITHSGIENYSESSLGLAMIYFDVLKRERLAVWMMDYASDYLVTLATLLSTSLKSTFTPLSYFLTSSWSDNPLD